MWWLGHDPAVLRHGDGALQLGADGEHRPTCRRTAGSSARGRSRASGAAPAADRLSARTTESSQRMWMGRSCCSKPSTSGPSRATASSSSWAIGSSLRLPLVITSGRPTPRQQQVVQRACTAASRRARQARARHRRRVAPVGAARREHDRPAGRRQRCDARRRRGRTSRRADASDRRPSRRTACRRGPCAGAARRPPLGWWRRRPGGSRRCPSSPRCRPTRSPRLRPRAHRCTAHRRSRRVAPRAAAGRTPGTRSAGRGSGGRLDRRTRPGTAAHIAKSAIVVAGRS